MNPYVALLQAGIIHAQGLREAARAKGQVSEWMLSLCDPLRPQADLTTCRMNWRDMDIRGGDFAWKSAADECERCRKLMWECEGSAAHDLFESIWQGWRNTRKAIHRARMADRHGDPSQGAIEVTKLHGWMVCGDDKTHEEVVREAQADMTVEQQEQEFEKYFSGEYH